MSEDRLVSVGKLTVLLPDFATTDDEVRETKGIITRAISLGPAAMSIWYAEGFGAKAESFADDLLKATRPKRHQRAVSVLGGTRFHRIDMQDTPRLKEFTVASVDLFGDLVGVAWGYVHVPGDDMRGPLDMLINSMVQGIVVRRQNDVSPEAIVAWMASQDALAARAAAKKPWWKLW